MFRTSGYRFSEKDMRQNKTLERIPINPIGMRSSGEMRQEGQGAGP
jgi:hypothetical protein